MMVDANDGIDADLDDDGNGAGSRWGGRVVHDGMRDCLRLYVR